MLERTFRAILLALTAATGAAHAADTPHIEGQIETDPGEGLLRGDVCITRIPRLAKYSFVLNRGLNIREVRDTASGKPLAYEGFYDSVGVGDGTRYTLAESAGDQGFCVSYTGRYPVYRVDSGERSAVDWKGQIAFDGHTVRAAEQTRFYPVVLSAAGAALDKVSYRLEISCTGCKAIYVNGAAPQDGPKATFASEIPRALLLYAGEFPYSSTGNVHFVGSRVTQSDAAAIREGIQTAADAEAAYMGVPYSDEPVYLTFASVSRTRKLGQTSWQFVTWPTIAMDGRIPFAELLHQRDGKRIYEPDEYIAHEMGHYYFGTRFAPQGPLRWFLLESTAEFLALRAYRTFGGAGSYEKTIRGYVQEALAAGDVVPLDTIKDEESIGDTYRYRLGPLLLLALEQYTGVKPLQQTLRGLVTEPPSGAVSYEAFRDRLIAAGATAAVMDQFERDCLRKPVASGCVPKLPELLFASSP
jgi:hypothetical protein